MKKCSKCKELKTFNEFSKNKSSKSGFEYSCKKCRSDYYNRNRGKILSKQKNYQEERKEDISIYGKKYRELNKKLISEYGKTYRKLNNVKISNYKRNRYNENKDTILSKNREYYERNKSTIISRHVNYAKNKRKTDPLFRAMSNLRSRINRFCKYAMLNKEFRTIDSVGLTADEFKVYIESLFTEGMSWDNYGIGKNKWAIDHIKPLCTAKTVDELFKLNHYTNLQPLWNPENIAKRGNWKE